MVGVFMMPSKMNALWILGTRSVGVRCDSDQTFSPPLHKMHWAGEQGRSSALTQRDFDFLQLVASQDAFRHRHPNRAVLVA